MPVVSDSNALDAMCVDCVDLFHLTKKKRGFNPNQFFAFLHFLHGLQACHATLVVIFVCCERELVLLLALLLVTAGCC